MTSTGTLTITQNKDLQLEQAKITTMRQKTDQHGITLFEILIIVLILLCVAFSCMAVIAKINNGNVEQDKNLQKVNQTESTK